MLKHVPMNNLREYKKKRDFRITSEPKPKLKKRKQTDFIYVIQKHKASNLHYDLRLELNGVLKSWALPKGPSTDPSQRKLAVPTEDHPIEYSDFEGIIPEGEYGAGTVIIWDKGTYRNLKNNISLEEAYDEGKVEIFIDGKKLKGAYVLLRTGKKQDKDERWLLIKMKDRYADARTNPIETEPGSVISGRKIEDIEKGQ
jgi:DNA ligase D-like protein (predicted 3'-phosphoesterase)